MFGRTLATLFWHSGLSELARRWLVRRGRFVLEFHGVAKRRVEELPMQVQPSFDVEGLRAVFAWLRGRFRALTPEELLRGGEPGVLLTFDDGFANNAANVVPLLEEEELPAVFFVATQHVLDPSDWLPATRRAVDECGVNVGAELRRDLFDGMSADELRRVARCPLVTIGSHTVSHPMLTRCDDASLAFELDESKRLLEELTERPVELFAYPAGDYDRRVAAAVRDAGYRAAFVEDSRRLGLGCWEIPRIGLYSAAPAYLAAKLSGLHRRPLRRLPVPPLPDP